MDLVDYSRGALRASSSRSSRGFAGEARASSDVDLHPDLGAARRQRRRALASDALVRGPAAARPPRAGRRRLRPPRRQAGALPGAVGDPPADGDAHRDYRGYAGQLAERRAAPRRRGRRPAGGGRTRIAAIDTFDGELEEAIAPMSVTLRLEDELDVSRGELICQPDEAPAVAPRARGRRLLDDRRAAARPARATCSSTPRAP